MKTSDFRGLKVWQKAMDLTMGVYDLVKKLPKEETYALSDQMRRSVVSIPSNIAEGYGRGSNKEFVRFLFIARGSLLELDTQIEICIRIGYIQYSDAYCWICMIQEIGKMINSLMSYRNKYEDSIQNESLCSESNVGYGVDEDEVYAQTPNT